MIKKKCLHLELEDGYGFAASSGWKGIGRYRYCTTCYKVIEFVDDVQCMSASEIKYNKLKREGEKQ